MVTVFPQKDWFKRNADTLGAVQSGQVLNNEQPDSEKSTVAPTEMIDLLRAVESAAMRLQRSAVDARAQGLGIDEPAVVRAVAMDMSVQVAQLVDLVGKVAELDPSAVAALVPVVWVEDAPDDLGVWDLLDLDGAEPTLSPITSGAPRLLH